MGAVLAERDAWQFQFVIDPPPNIRRLPEMCEGQYLRAASGNLPPGSPLPNTLADFSEGVATVQGAYVLIRGTTPTDLPELDFEFDGRVQVVRALYRFPRSPGDGELVASFEDAPADTLFVVADTNVEAKEIWYYTAFFGDAFTGRMTYSPVFGHSRILAVSNLTYDGVAYSKYGETAYNLLPTWFRKLDVENELTMFRICQVFGRVFDDFGDEMSEHLAKMYDIERVDAARLPYLDWMVAWPTNFELSEPYRRRETAEAVNFWKTKGTHGALATLIELLTGYTVEVYEGWRWVVTTGVEPFDPLVEPAGWDESTDGVWSSLVSATPLQATFDAANPDLPRNIGQFNDLLVYTPSTEVVAGAIGVPWRFQNTNGLLVVLRPIAGVTGAVSATLTRKVARFLPLFLGHYYAIGLVVSSFDDELWEMFASDEYLGFAVSVTADEEFDFAYEHESFVDEFATFHAFPHPDFPVMCRIGSPDFMLPSSVVTWTGRLQKRQVSAVTTGATRMGLIY